VAALTRLGHRDYDAAIGLVSEAAAADGTQPFEQPVIERLLRTVPADAGGYYEFSDGGYLGGSGNTFFVDQLATGNQVDWCSEQVKATIDTWPLLDARVSSSSLPLKLSDFLRGPLLRRNPWYEQIMRPSGVESQIKVWLPAGQGVVRGFFLLRDRGRRDFDERDRAILGVLRPHLAAVRERWERRRAHPLLTGRENEILQLVADGLTNGEIADRLVISPGTVRRHLENVFDKLGVHTRTAAAASLNDLRRSV